MLHQLLNLTRPLFVLDTETTGTDVRNDRIIELGFQQWMPEERCTKCEGIPSEMFKTPCEGCHGSRKIGGMTKEWRSFINPGIPIPPSATKVHGIGDEGIKTFCRHCQGLHIKDDHEWAGLPRFKQLASSFAQGFTNCDFAGQNVRFDLEILRCEMKRAGVRWSYLGARIVDSLRLEALLNPRDLSSLHAKYLGLPHDDAHGALSDVRAAATVITHQLQDGTDFPHDLTLLHELQWPGWLTADGSFRQIDGIVCCWFGKHKGRPVSLVPPDYWDWLLGADFSDDVKAIARRAKLKEF